MFSVTLCDMKLKQLFRDLMEIRRLPEVSVNLMHSEADGNDPFYSRIVREFFESTQKRHPKLPLYKALELGVAICQLPDTFEDYFMYIEASARRNYKKAKRNDYEFAEINYNDYLQDIGEVRRSADVRQGEMPAAFLKDEVEKCQNPPSLKREHDYPYYGVLRSGRLVAYAGCFIAGEMCMIEHIYGHADYQEEGIVPMLIVEIARCLYDSRPEVKYYGYGAYYGASNTMRRFKRKFKFLPAKVKWKIG